MVSPIAYYASTVAAINLITREIDPTLRDLMKELVEPIPPHIPPIIPEQEEEDEFGSVFGQDSPEPREESPLSSNHAQPAHLNMQAGQQGESENEEIESEKDAESNAHPALTQCWRGSVRCRAKHEHAITRSRKF